MIEKSSLQLLSKYLSINQFPNLSIYPFIYMYIYIYIYIESAIIIIISLLLLFLCCYPRRLATRLHHQSISTVSIYCIYLLYLFTVSLSLSLTIPIRCVAALPCMAHPRQATIGGPTVRPSVLFRSVQSVSLFRRSLRLSVYHPLSVLF
jgi:hypothetical protein